MHLQSSNSIGTCLPLHDVLQHGHVQARSCLFVPSIAWYTSVFAIFANFNSMALPVRVPCWTYPSGVSRLFDPPEASEWSCSISAALARSCPWEDSTTCCKAVQLAWLLWSTIQVYDQHVTNIRITLLTFLLTNWHIMRVISPSEPKFSCAWLILAAWSATLRSPRIKPLSSDLRCLPRAKVMAQ